MTITPSQRASGVSHFLVMEVLERAGELEAEGRDIVHLEVGEPDFDTPPAASQAGVEAIRSGRTHYTHSLGMRRLREDLTAHYCEEYGVDISPDRVIVTIGSSGALLLSFCALLDPGDEVLISDPGYPCYANIARSIGATPRRVPIRPETGFTFEPDVVEGMIGPRTKAIVLNSPANPTGVVATPETMSALAATGLAIVSDEVYHGLVYEGRAASALEVEPDAFVVGGFSKRYAMTGWRVGYAIVPDRFRRIVQALQQNIFISAADFAQHAAVGALASKDEVESMRRVYDERRRLLLEALPQLGLPVPATPAGAFYVFADARAYTRDSMAFVLDVLDRAGVAIAPGIDFGPGGEGFVRFSYATAKDRIEEGLGRLGRYLASL